MKTLSDLRIIAAAVAITGATFSMSSCSSYSSPATASAKAISSQGLVFSYNDQSNPQARRCVEAGPLPVRTQRALASWLAKSELKQVSFAYPQYFVEMVNPKTGVPSVWGLISDTRGNLVGVYIPTDNRPAWEMPTTADIQIYVCQGESRDSLSRAIMNSLADAGYDEERINARRSYGLTDEQYLISKPATIVAPVAAPAPALDEAAAPAPAAAIEETGDDAFDDEEADLDEDDSFDDEEDELEEDDSFADEDSDLEDDELSLEEDDELGL